MTPPAVSITEGEKETTSSSKRRSCVFFFPPENVTREDSTMAWTAAAPRATASSGLMLFIGILAEIEEVGYELHDTWDTSGTTDKDDFVDVRLVDLGVAPENFFDRTQKVLRMKPWHTTSSSKRARVRGV